jgi:Cysteine-rich secretory protein family
MKPWSCLTLGLVWLGVCGGLTGCKHKDTQADIPPVVHLSSLEKDVVQEINLARTQPKAYAAFLEQLRPNYVSGRVQGLGGRTMVTQGGKTTLMTAEGPKALDQAIAFLRSTPPLPPLEVSRGMSLGTRDHVKEQESTGVISHQGRDGSRPGDRVNRYGRWQGTISENIAYGLDSARWMTMALIIDDGLPDRGHRKNIFDAQARVVGVACSNRVAGQILCVTTFAAGYTEGAR